MKTGKVVGPTVAVMLCAVLLVCAVMWGHMQKQAAAGRDHHPAQQTSVAKS